MKDTAGGSRIDNALEPLGQRVLVDQLNVKDGNPANGVFRERGGLIGRPNLTLNSQRPFPPNLSES